MYVCGIRNSSMLLSMQYSVLILSLRRIKSNGVSKNSTC